MWLRASEDGGTSWGTSVRVDDSTVEPGVTMARRPYVTTDGSRIAVAFTDLDDGHVFVYTSAIEPIEFSLSATLSGGDDGDFNDFAKPLFVEGDLIVAWQSYTPTGWMSIARESGGWAVSEAGGGAPGLPCECCPLDVVASESGMWLAFRNNDDNIREHWVADLVGGTAAQATTTEGTLLACPMEGPRLALGGEQLLMVWSDTAADGRSWVADSEDGGESWSGAREIGSSSGTSSPTIAVGSDGRVWATTESGAGSLLAVSEDGGESFSAQEPLLGPAGELGYAQIEAGGDFVAAVGTTADGSLWLVRVAAEGSE